MIGAQEKKIRRIMIAAPKSGSGKTMITCGLLQIFKENGEDISSCKCGPDYIDPMFHRQVLGIPARNLDTFFTGEDGTRSLFLRDRREDELVVMEGVMGLYDGLGGIREEGSSYHLAKGKTYYVKARAYRKNSEGGYIYGGFSKVKKIRL